MTGRVLSYARRELVWMPGRVRVWRFLFLAALGAFCVMLWRAG